MTLAELIPSLRSSLPHPLEPWLWPSSTRHVPGGDLSVGGTSLVGVAAQHGTPAYVLDTAEFRARCAAYRSAFHDADVAYAGKALLTRAIARMVDEEGLSLDVCSEGELAVAVAERFPADRIILHGNAKPSSLLRRAMPMGVGRIVIDSLDEIETLAAVGFGAGRQRVLLRVTPGVDAHTHDAITTGTEDQKFGLSISSGASMTGESVVGALKIGPAAWPGLGRVTVLFYPFAHTPGLHHSLCEVRVLIDGTGVRGATIRRA